MTTNGSITKPSRRDRFASGAAVRLELSDGDWILVHTELSYGQQLRLTAAALSGVPAALADRGAGPPLNVDLATFDVERILTWVMDWSLVDADGEAVTVSREAVEALQPDTAGEIQTALNAHIEALEAKKAPPTSPRKPAATSSSASASAGRGKT